MVRIALSFVASFLLFYLESLIVIRWSGYEAGIHFADYSSLFVVFALNFFLAFSILTHLTPWFTRMSHISTDEDESSTLP
ncbi:MAG: hypothetical protein K0R57_2665 [Paenibacillaceae bacterium]|jgi:hypothetical protein|nr:hypothetical protein [Paenibacillaceae bacterium]